MPVASFNKKYLLALIGGKMDDKKLVEDIEKLGFGVERIDGDEIAVEVTSNRPDLLMEIGFARALRYFTHKSKRYGYDVTKESQVRVAVGKKVGSVRPFVSAFTVEGLSLDQDTLTSIINGIEKFCETHGRNRRKVAVGIHDMDRFDATNTLHYDAYNDDKYLPLNGTAELYFSEVLKGTEKGRDYANVIEDGNGGYPALRDSKGILALIPILNSERSKVTVSTKRMLVFIDGKSEYWVLRSADLLACMFLDIGGIVKKVSIDYGRKTVVTPAMEKTQIVIPLAKIENTIGLKIGENNATSLAGKMGYEAAYVGTKIRVTVPPYRLDVINEQDVIEDIAIGYGYDYIQPVPVKSGMSGQLEKATIFRNKATELMLGLGFTEAVNTYLTNENINFTKMRAFNDKNYISIRNARSESITMLRTWLLPSLLRNLGGSQHEKMPQKMFEVDMAFKIAGNGVTEATHLAAAATDAKMNFNYIKSVFDALAEQMKLDLKIEKMEHASFIEGRCTQIMLGSTRIGLFGEVHPAVLEAFGIEEPTTALEFDLTPFES